MERSVTASAGCASTSKRALRQRRDAVDPAVAEHGGRIVKNTGTASSQSLLLQSKPFEPRCSFKPVSKHSQSMRSRNAALLSAWVLT